MNKQEMRVQDVKMAIQVLSHSTLMLCGAYLDFVKGKDVDDDFEGVVDTYLVALQKMEGIKLSENSEEYEEHKKNILNQGRDFNNHSLKVKNSITSIRAELKLLQKEALLNEKIDKGKA